MNGLALPVLQAQPCVGTSPWKTVCDYQFWAASWRTGGHGSMSGLVLCELRTSQLCPSWCYAHGTASIRDMQERGLLRASGWDLAGNVSLFRGAHSRHLLGCHQLVPHWMGGK